VSPGTDGVAAGVVRGAVGTAVGSGVVVAGAAVSNVIGAASVPQAANAADSTTARTIRLPTVRLRADVVVHLFGPGYHRTVGRSGEPAPESDPTV
jgi:hypothetical protein